MAQGLVFASEFECGNHAKAVRVDENEYDVHIRPDSLCPRYRLWFYFSVTNHLPNQSVIINIVNFSKARSLYKDGGMTPVVRSHASPAWQRLNPKNVIYHRSPAHKNAHVLSFAFTFGKQPSSYYFAYTYPFSYSELQCGLGLLDRLHLPFLSRGLLCRSVQGRRVDVIIIAEQSRAANKAAMRRCGSALAANRALRAVGHLASSPTVSGADAVENSTVSSDAKCRPVVVMTGRVHPGEVPASHVMQGLLQFLCSSDAEAALLRRSATWVLVPMLNPDGVAVGNYRADGAGADLNRSWLTANATSEPANHAVLGLLQHFAEEGNPQQLAMFMDVHAHSTSPASFLFCNQPGDGAGCGTPVCNSTSSNSCTDDTAGDDQQVHQHVQQPQQQQQQQQQQSQQPVLPQTDPTQLPRLLSELMPGFSLASCVFDDSPAKAGCARRVAGMLFAAALSYTLEVSLFHSLDPDAQGAGIGANTAATSSLNTIQGYHDMGRQLARAFIPYFGLQPPSTLSRTGSGSSSSSSSKRPDPLDAHPASVPAALPADDSTIAAATSGDDNAAATAGASRHGCRANGDSACSTAAGIASTTLSTTAREANVQQAISSPAAARPQVPALRLWALHSTASTSTSSGNDTGTDAASFWEPGNCSQHGEAGPDAAAASSSASARTPVPPLHIRQGPQQPALLKLLSFRQMQQQQQHNEEQLLEQRRQQQQQREQQRQEQQQLLQAGWLRQQDQQSCPSDQQQQQQQQQVLGVGRNAPAKAGTASVVAALACKTSSLSLGGNLSPVEAPQQEQQQKPPLLLPTRYDKTVKRLLHRRQHQQQQKVHADKAECTSSADVPLSLQALQASTGADSAGSTRNWTSMPRFVNYSPRSARTEASSASSAKHSSAKQGATASTAANAAASIEGAHAHSKPPLWTQAGRNPFTQPNAHQTRQGPATSQLPTLQLTGTVASNNNKDVSSRDAVAQRVPSASRSLQQQHQQQQQQKQRRHTADDLLVKELQPSARSASKAWLPQPQRGGAGSNRHQGVPLRSLRPTHFLSDS